MDDRHQPVLLNEVIEALNIHAGGFYVDGTFGRGGHSVEILKRLGPQGRLLAFDKDPDAVQSAAATSLLQDERFNLIQGTFAMLSQSVTPQSPRMLDGVLLDLGVCSSQLGNAVRGFSFRLEGALDMRMDPNTGQSLAVWLNKASETAIADVIYQYGEERAARKIAKAIVAERASNPIMTTTQLATLVSKIVGSGKKSKKKNIHPATKTFQAFRIYINHELEDLKAVLPQATELLQAGGRLAVISFHSLEDRIVKRFMRHESTESFAAELPPLVGKRFARLKSISKKTRATTTEFNQNPRSRSAILRVAERCRA